MRNRRKKHKKEVSFTILTNTLEESEKSIFNNIKLYENLYNAIKLLEIENTDKVGINREIFFTVKLYSDLLIRHKELSSMLIKDGEIRKDSYIVCDETSDLHHHFMVVLNKVYEFNTMMMTAEHHTLRDIINSSLALLDKVKSKNNENLLKEYKIILANFSGLPEDSEEFVENFKELADEVERRRDVYSEISYKTNEAFVKTTKTLLGM